MPMPLPPVTLPPSAVRPQALTNDGDLFAQTALPSLQVSTGAVLRLLTLVAAGLVLLHALVVLTYLADWPVRGADRFYMDREGNVPTWFAALILLLAALLLAVIAGIKHTAHDPFRLHWLALSLLFVGLSLDEAASFHEILIKPLAEGLGLSGLLRFAWVLAGALFVAGVFVAYLRFLASLPARTRQRFVVSGAIYVLGAIGMEMVGGYYFIENRTHGAVMVPYMMAMTLEESLEMAGILAFIHALLQYLQAGTPSIELRLG